jgi:hypothetical protein
MVGKYRRNSALFKFPGHLLGIFFGTLSVNSWSGFRPGMAFFAIPLPLHPLKLPPAPVTALFRHCCGVDCGLNMD